MNYNLVIPVLLVLVLPVAAQSNLSQQELQVAAKACGEDRVCLFGVVELQFKHGMTAEELANPFVPYAITIGGIDASVEAELLAQKRDILDRGIQLLEESFYDPDEPYFRSSPLHLLRAELCLKTTDDACFLQSAALLLEREIASREEGIKWEQKIAFVRDGNKDHLSPPIRWSDIRDIRYDSRRSGGPKFGWGSIELYLNKVGPGNTDTRIDAILSDYERRRLSDSLRRVPPVTVVCEAPQPEDGSEVVFLSGYEGAAISTLAVSGLNDVTSVAKVTIEEGTTSLYVFATAYDAIVWKFEGATDRVKQVVVQPRIIKNGSGAAVAGIDADKIVFVRPKSCVDSYVYRSDGRSDMMSAQLAVNLGRSIDHLVVGYEIDSILVPSGTQVATKAYDAPIDFRIGERRYRLSRSGMQLLREDSTINKQSRTSQATIRNMMKFYSGGMVPLSMDEVHFEGKVEPYDVLPEEAGLLQLIAEGAIEVGSHGAYFIKEPIPRFPAGLGGAHMVRFVIASGVPVPSGSAGHSNVTLEGTGECVLSPSCR